MTSSWPLARLQPPAWGRLEPPISLRPDPELVAAAEAELLALPGRRTLADGRRYAAGETAAGPAGWFEGVGTFVLDAARGRIAAAAPGADGAAWEHLALGWALPSLLGELGSTVLHSCAIAAPGRAWIICAHSGMGKTTTSLALREHGMQLLSDDMAVVTAGAPYVCAGPRGSRVLGADGTKTLHFSEPTPPAAAAVPLAGLGVLLARGTGELHRRLPEAEAFIALLPHVCFASDNARRRMVHRVADLARSLPVVAISMPDDLARLPAAAAQLARALV